MAEADSPPDFRPRSYEDTSDSFVVLDENSKSPARCPDDQGASARRSDADDYRLNHRPPVAAGTADGASSDHLGNQRPPFDGQTLSPAPASEQVAYEHGQTAPSPAAVSKLTVASSTNGGACPTHYEDGKRVRENGSGFGQPGAAEDSVLDMALPPSLIEKVQSLVNENNALKEALRRTNEVLREKFAEVERLRELAASQPGSQDEQRLQAVRELQDVRSQLDKARVLESQVRNELEAERQKNHELARRVAAFTELVSLSGKECMLDTEFI